MIFLLTRQSYADLMGELLGSGIHLRHASKDLLCRGHDLVPVRAEDPDLRLSEVRPEVPDQLRENAECLAAENGIEIEFLRKCNVHKEDRVKEMLAQRGNIRGRCASSRPRNHAPPTSRGTTRKTGRTIYGPMTASAMKCGPARYFAANFGG